MRRNDHQAGNNAAVILISASLFVILFLTFALGTSLLEDISPIRQIENFKNGNAKIELENENLKLDFAYFSSPQYRDKWAKEHKGVAQPGEKVIVIEFSPEGIIEDSTQNRALLKKEILLSHPNREQWRIFFFGDEEKGG